MKVGFQSKGTRARRRSAWLALVALITAQASGLIHLATVQHSTCAAHGEVSHEGAESHANEHADGPVMAPEFAHSSGDEHCEAATYLGQRAETVELQLLTFGAAPLPWAVPLASAASRAPVSPLMVAPKNSPPTA